MPIRTSKTEHEYPYGHRRRVGDHFHVDDSDVHVLLALGRIDAEPGDQGYVSRPKPDVPVQQTYATRDMTANRGKRSNNRKAT